MVTNKRRGVVSKAVLEALRNDNKRYYYAKQGRDYDAEMLAEKQAKKKAAIERAAEKVAKIEKAILNNVTAKNITVSIYGETSTGMSLFKVNGKRASEKIALGTVRYFLDNKLYEQNQTLTVDCRDGLLQSLATGVNDKLEQAEKIIWAIFNKNDEVEKIMQPYIDEYGTVDFKEVTQSTEKSKMKLIDKMRELVAAQKKNHKSIIDWDSFFEDNAIMELRALQKDLKYFASVGKMKQATKTFENLKLCYKNYRAINAA